MWQVGHGCRVFGANGLVSRKQVGPWQALDEPRNGYDPQTGAYAPSTNGKEPEMDYTEPTVVDYGDLADLTAAQTDGDFTDLTSRPVRRAASSPSRRGAFVRSG